MTTANTFSLRPYQQASVDAVLAEWNKVNSTLGVMATGGGKTILGLEILHRVIDGKRAMWMAHRDELITQPLERMQQFFPDMAKNAGIVKAEQNHVDAQIIIATVQTVSRENRMAAILEHGPIDYLISDEAHHATSDTHEKVQSMLLAANPNMKHLGITATPKRADGKAMRNVFESVAFKYGIKELVKQGWLCPPRWLAIQTGISLGDVHSRAGDFVVGELADVFETDNCFDLVVESYKKYAAGRQFLSFTASVAGAYELAKKFQEAGIDCEAADAKTHKDDRREIMRGFRNGELQGLANVGLWTEGLDVPQVSCILQVRPTQSDGLYCQMVGRALRIVPGKEDALIIDFCPADSRDIVMMGDLLGVKARKEVYIKADQEPGEVIGGFTFDGKVKWLTGDPMELISRQLDYLDASPWVWTQHESGYSVLGLGQGSDEIERTLVVSPVADQVKLFMVAKYPDKRTTAHLIREGELVEVLDWCEGYANQRGNAMLAQKNKQWRKKPASAKLIAFATKLGVWNPTMSMGAASSAVTRQLALNQLKRAGLI